MKKLSLEEIKELELEMLLYIDKVCRENNIKYFLDSGTLLGAIRHKGFIPWDDDVDIILFRDDYEKLIDILKNKENQYLVIDDDTDSYIHPFAKLINTDTRAEFNGFIISEILGVFIDIFPIDPIPNEPYKRKIFFSKIWYSRKFIQSISFNDIELNNKQKFISKISKKIGHKYFNRIIKNERYKHSLEKTTHVTTILASFKKEKILEKDWFKEQIYVTFEDYQFPVPNGYDEYLKKLYGNYMTLPPKEQQVGHDMDIYMK